MAESFLFNIAEKVLGKLASPTLQDISLAWDVNNDMKRLDDTLSTIKAVLLDAEEKQEKNHELSIWLSKLKHVCYDAEDVVVDFECKALQSQATNSNKVRRFFSWSNNPLVFRFKIGRKMRHIRDRLDEIAAQKAKFHLTERLVDERVVYKRREMTHSFVHASDVFGRDLEKEQIVENLLHHGDQESLSVVPIVGIGGLGKTTLAKIVYNDERVDEHFELKMWVCVSEDFDVARLIKDIICSATGENYGDLTMDQLQLRLRRILGHRRFLLVLDDVWNDDRVKWIELRDLLVDCCIGSKIVVTTRSSLVASIMGDVPTYNLPGLKHKDCLSLFLKWAFSAGQEKQYPNLVEIGNEIVKKCGGVPLAVRTLGSLLYSSINERDWLFIRDNEIWKFKQKENDILPVLKLSYDQMPSYLKQCFAYCSLFPKGSVFNSFELIQLWMACGLLESPYENRELEDIGMRYVKELWSRSFFQDVVHQGFLFTWKMHDLIHDLALSVAQSECSTVNFLTQIVPENVRHLSFLGTNLVGQEVPRILDKLDSVRTIFFPITGLAPSSQIFVDTTISRLKYLRVLNLSDSCFEILPSSINNLLHLRYLDLCRNRKIRELPESFYSLHNLQTLRLDECEKLEKVSEDIKNMISLRFLEITTKQGSLPESGIGCLSSLRFLSLFECGNLECLFDNIQNLTSLRTLVIASCGSLTCLPRTIKYLTALETLVIGDCGKLDLMEMESDEDFKMSLSSILIGELPQLETLPQWLLRSSGTLQYIYIDDCPNFTALPEWLKDLTSLQKLEIIRCPELFSMPEDMHCLTALRELKIGLCPQLRERCEPETGKDWLKIAHIPELFLDGVMVQSSSD